MIRHLMQCATALPSTRRLSTLILHRVLGHPDPLLGNEMDAAHFDQVCRWLARWFVVLPLDEACRRLADGTLPARALSISFDDGYADNHDVALPILRRYGLTATFFVASGFLDGGSMWNDKLIESVRRVRTDAWDVGALGVPGLGVLRLRTFAERRSAVAEILRRCKHLPSVQRDEVVARVAAAAGCPDGPRPMMTSAQVRALVDAGMTIGAHTVTHPILASLPTAAARTEIVAGREALQAITGRPVTLFAYPNGVEDVDFRDEHVRLVREAGFAAAFTTSWGAADRCTDRFRIPRFTPWDRTAGRFGLRMLRNLVVRPRRRYSNMSEIAGA